VHSGPRPNCESFNEAVVRDLRARRPDVVLLEAHWALYTGENGQPDITVAAVRRTIDALDAIGIRRVVVMGSLPTWKIVQPRVAFEIWRRDHVLEDRTAEYLDAEPFAADRRVREAVAGTPATFVSPLELLCRSGSCLLSADPERPTPIAWDNDHLSLAGSRWVADRALKSILGSNEPAT
jgi:hypothetical protein